MSKENFEEIKIKVEAILFSYGDWIDINDLKSVLGIDSDILVKNSLMELVNKYRDGFAFAVEINDLGKWRMALKSQYEDLVSDVISNVEIPAKVLKVLSVIAYEQPVTKTRLSEILGKSVKQEVSYLYKSKFVSYEKKGIGKYYRVTKKFFDYFKIDENDEFRKRANENITHFLEEGQEQKELQNQKISEIEEIGEMLEK